MPLPNHEKVHEALQSVLDVVELHRPVADAANDPAVHAFLDTVQAHFEKLKADALAASGSQ